MRGHDNQNKAWAEAQDERRYMQETRRAAAAAHQRQLWKQQKEKRMNRKGARAQMLLAQAFEQHGGKVPEGEAMEKLVEATKCSPTEIEGWFKCESSNGQPQPLTRRLMPTVAATDTKRQKQERATATSWGAMHAARAPNAAITLSSFVPGAFPPAAFRPSRSDSAPRSTSSAAVVLLATRRTACNGKRSAKSSTAPGTAIIAPSARRSNSAPPMALSPRINSMIRGVIDATAGRSTPSPSPSVSARTRQASTRRREIWTSSSTAPR